MIDRIAVIMAALCSIAFCQARDSTVAVTGNTDSSIAMDSLNAISLAMKMELASIEHYSSFERTTPVKEFARIYRLLLPDETRHYRLLETWGKDEEFKAEVPTDVLEKAKEMIESFPIDTFSAEMASDTANSLLQVLNDDLNLEKQSVSLYQEAISKTSAFGPATVLTFICNEEKKHVQLLEALIELAKKPGDFLKSAEFNKMDR